jgi:DNA-directed RNA polymerase subunit alpha
MRSAMANFPRREATRRPSIVAVTAGQTPWRPSVSVTDLNEKIDTAAVERAVKAGSEADRAGDSLAAIEAYREAVDLGCDDPEIFFRLAYLLDLRGEELAALALYEECCEFEPPHINALINLAIVHEDRGDIARAERCLRQVLETEPNHPRARLYMRDVRASRDMYYDEEHARDQAKRNALLDTLVTDFELSVRSRNTLRRMGVRTLGDLVKISEAELLSYKNFGETSLTEIKEMLQSKNLRLGQGVESGGDRPRKSAMEALKGKASADVLNKPVSVLELTVRPRRAIQMLNILTIGDLAMRTEAELMGIKNFGANSLDEIKSKLSQFGLTLREVE